MGFVARALLFFFSRAVNHSHRYKVESAGGVFRFLQDASHLYFFRFIKEPESKIDSESEIQNLPSFKKTMVRIRSRDGCLIRVPIEFKSWLLFLSVTLLSL